MATVPIDRRSFLAGSVVVLAGCLGDEDEQSPEQSASSSYDGYISVSDQVGDGSSVTVTAASASVDYYLELRYDGQATVSDTFSAEQSATDVELPIAPELDNHTTVRVSILLRTAADDESVLRREIEYTVDRPEGRLSLTDQSGTGDVFVVDEATADAPFYLLVEYAGERFETGQFEADRTVESLPIDLDPSVDGDQEMVVTLYTADEERELATETISYDFERTASLRVSDQIGDGHTLAIDRATANVPFEVVARYAGAVVETSTFAARSTVEPDVDLDPRLLEETTVEVSVRASEDGAELKTVEVAFTPESPDGPELTETAAIRLAQDTFPFIGTPDVFEGWFDNEIAVESHPDGYRVRLGYLAVRQRAIFSSDADRTEQAIAEFAIDVFESLFTSDYQILDIEIDAWLTSETDGFDDDDEDDEDEEFERASEIRLDRSAAGGVDWDDLREEPAENLPPVAETYRFDYFERS
jgi:hypothetical protein